MRPEKMESYAVCAAGRASCSLKSVITGPFTLTKKDLPASIPACSYSTIDHCRTNAVDQIFIVLSLLPEAYFLLPGKKQSPVI
jgi:hypothetical protein